MNFNLILIHFSRFIKKWNFLFFVFIAISLLSGCLTVESKEYTFKIKKNNSGTATIKYINIMTDKKDSTEGVESDFRELIDSYYNGDKIKIELTGFLDNLRITSLSVR